MTSPFWIIGEIVVTGFVGLRLLRGERISRLRRGLVSINIKRERFLESVEGIFLAIAGALLLLPGFVTDFLGVLVLIGPTRIYIMKTIFSNFFSTRGPDRFERDAAFNMKKNRSGNTIEGDFKRRD
jgi:UPF0716 protein FxsA